MKKRVLSLFMALALCLTMLPTAALAEEAGAAPDTGNVESVYTIGDDTVVQIGEESDPVQVAQALIDALPEDVTAENAEEIEQQLMALEAALEALTEEQLALLDMTRYEALCAALVSQVSLTAERGGEHADHPICGDASCNKHGASLTDWVGVSELSDDMEAGYYYLIGPVTRTSTWYPKDGVVLCLNGYSISMDVKNNNNDSTICVNGGVTFTLCDCQNKGTVTHGMNDTAKYTGSGVWVENGNAGGEANFVLYSGSISGNEDDNFCAGVHVGANASFTMHGGSISGNKTAGYGGGVYVQAGTTSFTMTGGTITGNSAGHDGGGVYVKNGSFTMTGGSITNNTVGNGCNGGGVYAYSEGTVILSGAAVVTANKNTDGATNNIYLDKTYDAQFNDETTFTIDEGGLSENASIGVTVDANELPTTDGSYITIAEAAEGYTITAEDAKRVSADAGTDYNVRRKDNTLVLFRGELPHEHPICGAAHKDINGHTGACADVTWTAWDGVSDITYDANNTAYVYLRDNAERDSALEIANGYTLYLCLSGHSLTKNKTGKSVIKVGDNATLSLCDCSDAQSGKLTHGTTASGLKYTGHGVSLGYRSTFNMYGGSITGNRADTGGGVSLASEYSYAKFNMYGGSITNNAATNGDGGGGVHNLFGTFTMYGGSITGNSADTRCGGGGVYLARMGEFVMKGGEITGNTAKNGGGVYTAVNGNTGLTVSGDAAITGNSNTAGKDENVYLVSGKTIEIGADGLGEKASIGVTTADTITTGSYVTVANGAENGYTDGDIFSDAGGAYCTLQEGDNVNLYNGQPHRHPICGEVCGHTGGTHADADWTAWDGVSDIVYDANNTAYVYLTGDAERDTTLTVEKGYTLYLCLNGYSLTMKAEGEVISVTGSFTLTDCRGGDDTKPYGKITHAAGVDGRGVSITSAADASLSETAVFTMYGGEISGNKVSDSGSINYGGGVRVSDPYSTFTMLGGIITNNEATNGGGGGVYIGGGRFEMSGSAVITRNKTASSLGGGGVFMNGSDTVYALNEFIMSGNAVISENTATNGNGGGVYMNSAPEVTMNGGSITGNTAANNGGGVYAFSGTFTMNDGTIAGNKATAKNGGGVYANGSTAFTVKGGTIGGSTAADANAAKYGGGVYVKNGTFTMSGGKVTGNSASKDGGGVRLDKGTFNMSGSAVISRNTADGYGGGVDANDGSFTMSGGSITGNTTTNESPNWSGGGGVCVFDDGKFTMSGGSITGNNAIRGGGVELVGSGTMTVSGSVQITGNWQNGELDSANGLYVQGSSGKPENLYLYSGKTVAIGTDGLNADAHIGVSTEDWPDPGSPVKIATNATNEESHYTAIFTPDAEEADYKITKKNDNALYLSAHEHTWTYTADAATHTITAKCSECQQTGGSVTLQAPDESTLTYDGNGKAATVTASSNWQGPAVSGITIGYTYEVNGHPTMLSPGEAPINARAYTASITLGGKEVSVQYTINKAELTIKANDNTIVYGDTASDKGVTYSGFVNGEGESVLGGELTYIFSYTPGSDTGLYIITPAGQISDNYDVTVTPGTLTVEPREVTLTWYNYENRTYGDGKYVFATADNLLEADAGKVVVELSGNAANASGTFTAIAERLTGDKAGNYKLPENATKEYTIGLAEQKLTFAKTGDQSLTYGDTLENPAKNNRADGSEVTYSSSDPNVATVDENGTVTARNVGTTTITATAAAVTGKYSEATASYKLTVTKRPISLTITPVTYYYGQPGVSFTPSLRTVSGSLAEGDDYKTLKLSWSSVGTMWKAGTFDVKATSYNSNYNVTFDGTGKLIVLPRPITVTVDAASRVYGDADPAFTAQQTGGMGFVNGETVASLGLSLSSTATATSPVGSYNVTGTASNGNYAVTVEGKDALTITPKAITVTVNEASRPYGEANPAFTATALPGALVGDDTIESLNLTLSSTATTTSDVRSYDVTGSANNRNYEVTIDGANKLTVTKKELTANDLEFTDTPITKVYDGKTDATVTVQINDSAKVKAEDVLPTVTGTATYNSKDVQTANKVTFVSARTESKNYILPADLTREHEASITKRVISIKSVTTAPKQYDRDTNAWSCITDVSFDNLVSGETLTKSKDYGITEATFNSADVELANTITGVVGITNPNLNYTFVDETGSETSRASFTTSGKISKANGGTLDPVELTIRCTNRDEQIYTIDQSKLPGGQIWTFSTSAAMTGKAALSTNTIGANTGVLTYQLSDGAAGDTVTWTVTASCANYQSFTLAVTLTLIARDEQTGFKFENNTTSVTKTYGDEDFTIAASGGATGSSVTYTSSDETVAKVDEDGKVTIVGAGITTIKAKASETADFEEKEISYTLTVKPKTLAKDDLTYSGSITKVYDGSTNAPSGLTVSVDPSSLVNGDTLTVNGTLKFNSANVGEASEITFIPTAITTGNYTLAATEALTIRSASITAKEVTLTSGINATNRSYAKDNKTVALTKGTLAFTGLVSGETLDVNIPDTGTIFDTKVGTYNVTYSGVTLKDGTTGKASNYKLVGSLPTVTVTISKAAAPVLADIPVSFKYTVTTGEKAIGNAGIPADAGTLTYSKGTATKTGTVTVTSWDVDSTTGKVTYTLSGGKAGDSATLFVTIASTNYEDATVNVVITLTARDNQVELRITGGTTVVYGQTLALNTSGGSGSGAVTYTVVNGTGEATIDPNTGVLTPVKVGSVSVIATKAGDNDYNAVTSAPVEITITKATPTGEPKYTEIKTGGKTLADAALTIEGSTLKPNAGTLEWVDDKGNVLSNDTKVEANTTYKWRFTPTDGNYTVLTGSIELYHKSSSGGSGWYYTYYTIKATAGTNGSISPSGWTSVRDGRDQTFTITPDKGYAVAKVLVDGKSVGAVKSYTFKNVTKDHTIEAIFMKSNGNPQTGVFVDVAEGSYYEEAIDWAVEKGITNGVSSNMFAPNDPCTRAQIVTFLWRAAGSPAPKSMSSFTDVPADAFYAKAVAWAVENGITSGTGESKFSPNSTCTRAQAVTFLYRASGSPAVSGKAEFSDVSTTAFYADAVAWAAKKGITTGIGGGLFGSDNDCTRGQIVTFLWRAMAE